MTAYFCSSKKLKAILQTGQGDIAWALGKTLDAWAIDEADEGLEGRAWAFRGNAIDEALAAEGEEDGAGVLDALRAYWGENS